MQAAKDGAADARATVDKVLPAASRFLSRFAYTTSYAISYGVVFATVLLAKSIPTNNAVVHGMVDGTQSGRHGRSDEESASSVIDHSTPMTASAASTSFLSA